MYRTLKQNFSSICLDSVFLTKFISSVRIPMFSLSTSSLYIRRRSTFLYQAMRLRYYLLKSWRECQFLCNPVTTSFVRNIDILPFLRCFGLKFSSKRAPRTYLPYFREKFNNRKQGTLVFSLLRSFYGKVSTSLLISNKVPGISRIHSSSYPLYSFPSSVIFSERTSLFFYQFFRSFISETHTVSFYFQMMMRNFKFRLGDGKAFFFFKKLVRLSFYQLGLRLISSRIGVFSSTFKTVLCGYFFCDSCNSNGSSIVYNIISRLITFLLFDHSTFMKLITSGHLQARNFLCIRKYVATHLLKFNRNSSIFSASSFFSFVSGFSRSVLQRNFYMMARVVASMRKTFNLFINNSSTRNVFSSLNRGNKMIYGTTSGSFKLHKRIRYRKHAMFMVAAKFYRTIAHYYKAKAVRSLNMNFTGYRRSFGIVFQFFRNLLRQNIKYHFTPLQVLFKFQPFSSTKFSSLGTARLFSFFNKRLRLRMKRYKFSTKLRGYYSSSSQLSKFSGAHSFFYTNSFSLVKFKNAGHISFRQYSTCNYPTFMYKPSSVDNNTSISFVSTIPSLVFFETPVLSSWLYSSVYKSIIRTRRHYKVHKKLIAPLIASTQVDCFDHKISSTLGSRSFLMVRSLRSRNIANAVHTYNSFFSYDISYKRCASYTYSKSLQVQTQSYSSSFSTKRSFGSIKRKKRFTSFKKRPKVSNAASFRLKINKLSPRSYLSVFRTRMAIFLNTIFSGSTVRYRPVISHGGCYKRKRISDRRYWF